MKKFLAMYVMSLIVVTATACNDSSLEDEFWDVAEEACEASVAEGEDATYDECIKRIQGNIDTLTDVAPKCEDDIYTLMICSGKSAIKDDVTDSCYNEMTELEKCFTSYGYSLDFFENL